MEGYQWGGRIGGKGTGNKKHHRQAQNRQGEIKNSNRKWRSQRTYVHNQWTRTKWWGGVLEGKGCREEGDKGGNKTGTNDINK